MIRQISLLDEERGLTSVVFPRTGVALQTLNIDPSVREVIDDRTGSDGLVDNTLYLGPSAVSMSLRLFSATRALLDEFSAFLAPWARPYLVISDTDWTADRRIRLRTDTYSKPLEAGQGLTRVVQFQWKAPDGIMEGATLQTVNVMPTIDPTTGLVLNATVGGFAVNSTLGGTGGFAMHAANVAGALSVTTAGTARSHWTAFLYGPCAGPKLSNDSTGQDIIFTDDLTLNPGEYVALDSRNRTVYFMSDPNTSYLSFVDYADSDWFVFEPGDNEIRFHPSSASSGSVAQIFYRPGWIP